VTSCIFCSIADGSVASDVVLEDGDVIAFRDTNPQAPTHVLVIPREHIASAAALTEDRHALWGRMLAAAQRVAESEGLSAAGYRLVANIGKQGGQTVDHLHVHVLGGRQMTWPPG
jgi:histidine triad (HIT) family protein